MKKKKLPLFGGNNSVTYDRRLLAGLLGRPFTVTRLHSEDTKISMHDFSPPSRSAPRCWRLQDIHPPCALRLTNSPRCVDSCCRTLLFPTTGYSFATCTRGKEKKNLNSTSSYLSLTSLLEAMVQVSTLKNRICYKQVARASSICMCVVLTHFRAGMPKGKYQPLWFS